MNVPLPDLTISHEQRTAWLEMLQRWANINSGTHHLEGLVRMRETLLEDFRILGVAP